MPTPQADASLPRGVELRARVDAAGSEVATPQALELVADLARRFGWRVDELLERRLERQLRLDRGDRPDFPAETASIRSSDWTAAPPPPDLLDRRVEIIGPPDRRTVEGSLRSGASVFVADLEDGCSPTWENVLGGQASLRDAVRRTEGAPGAGEPHRPAERAAVLMVRPRGWHLVERHLAVDGRPVPAALFDFGVFFHLNARELVARGSGPYLYLPKLEGSLEARLWNDVFLRAQEALGIPRGTVRATALVETLPAAFEMHEILWELREHAAGLAFGRWDYVFSLAKRLRSDPAFALPDREELGADEPFLGALVQLLVQTCHRRGVHALGAESAQIPIPDDPAANEAALARVRAEKLREVRAGLDGSAVAHPALVPVARAVFDEHVKTPNQIHVRREEVRVGREELLRAPRGARTEAGLRHAIRVCVRYLEAWLRGAGRLSLHALAEDAATAEICRAQAWQWIRHGVSLEGGGKVTDAYFRRLLAEEMDRIHVEVGDRRFSSGRFGDARALFERLATAPELAEFLTLPAYELLAGDPAAAAAVHAPGAAAEGPAPWHPDPRRWEGIERPYSRADVERLRGTLAVEHTLARQGALRLWDLLHTEPYVHALGALTGNQAVQMVKAGLKAIYVSGWQVAADGNTAGQTYPDQSLYPADSVPALVRRINRALQRADQIAHAEGRDGTAWFAPVVADAEAGFGGPLNAFELTKALVEAGAAAVHFEDQLAAEKKCGHMGGKVLVPARQFVRTLVAARLAADVLGVPTLLVARTDASAARLLTSDVDPRDREHVLPGERTPEGFHRFRGGLEAAVARALAYAPYADALWCETSTPDLGEARRFAEAVHARFPGKLLAYNCSPSFNWKKNLDDASIERFQRELAEMGYRFQFVTLAGFHAISHATFALAREYRDRGMSAYTELQQAELAAEKRGYTATRHQQEVGTGYFDLVAEVVSGGQASTRALAGSTEAAQFTDADRLAAARASMQEDHRDLEGVAARVRAARDGPALVGALEELARFLGIHFEREERDQGIFGILGEAGADEGVDALLAEHREILAEVQALATTVRQGMSPGQAGERAAAAVARLEDHERREHALAEGALRRSS